MTVWASLLILIGAIAFLVAVQLVRAVMAVTLPRISVRLLPESTPPPAALADLLEHYRDELKDLDGPYWVWLDPENKEVAAPNIYAIYRIPNEQSVLLMGPPQEPTQPNRPLLSVSSTLTNGKEASTDAYGVLARFLATPSHLGQVIACQGPVDLLREHRRWLAGMGLGPGPHRLPLRHIESHLREGYHHQLNELTNSGFFKWVSGGVKPGWRAGLKLLYLILTQPKPEPSNEVVPLARLKYLAGIQALINRARPLNSVQWTLFTFSGLIFVVLGAWFWDIQFALILLAIIVFHELGHYLAMRWFGYRQVQMLLLPLAGGITVGVEEKPNSVHRAWISLMGPLPGIVLGWVFLFMGLTQGDWAFALVLPGIILLVVNYLNLLPVPPLDGGQLLRVLLPPHRYRLQVGFVAAACILGIVVSVWMGFYLLAMIAAFPLLGLGSTLSLGKLFVAEGLNQYTGADTPQARNNKALEVLDRAMGPCHNAKQRLDQALELAAGMGLKPVSGRHQLVIGAVYLALFAFPVSAGALAVLGWQDWLSTDDAVDYWAYREQEHRRTVGMDMPELVAQWLDLQPLDDTEWQPSEYVFDALPDGIPAQLAQLYRMTPPPVEAGLVPANLIGRGVDCAGEQLEEIADEQLYASPTEPSGFYDYNADNHFAVNSEGLGNWWCPIVGEYSYHRLLVAPDGDNLYPGYSVVSLDQRTAYQSLEDYWRTQLVSLRTQQHLERDRLARQSRTLETLAEQDMAGLLSAIPKPPLLVRLVAREPSLPGPADPTSIRTAQQRLTPPLPQSYLDLVARHNGHPYLNLLPVERVVNLSEWPLERGNDEWLTEALASWNHPLAEPGHCLVLGAAGWQHQDLNNHLSPMLLYCQAGGEGVYYSIWEEKQYDRLLDYIRQRIAATM